MDASPTGKGSSHLSSSFFECSHKIFNERIQTPRPCFWLVRHIELRCRLCKIHSIVINFTMKSTLAVLASVVVTATASMNPSPPSLSLGALTDFCLVSLDGSSKFKWQNSDSGWAGDVFVGGSANTEDPQDLLFGDDIYTDGAAGIVNFERLHKIADTTKNSLGADVAFVTDKTDLELTLGQSFNAAVQEILSYSSTTSKIPDDFLVPDAVNFKNGVDETIVIDIRTDQVKQKIMYVTGDPGDIVIFRWDDNQACATNNVCTGKVEIKEGSAIIPLGGLQVNHIFHLADYIHAGGSSDPPPQQLVDLGYGQPAYPDGTALPGSVPFAGGFFVGYWLLTGSVVKGDTLNVIGGLYTNTPHLEITHTSGMRVAAGDSPASAPVSNLPWNYGKKKNAKYTHKLSSNHLVLHAAAFGHNLSFPGTCDPGPRTIIPKKKCPGMVSGFQIIDLDNPLFVYNITEGETVDIPTVLGDKPESKRYTLRALVDGSPTSVSFYQGKRLERQDVTAPFYYSDDILLHDLILSGPKFFAAEADDDGLKCGVSFRVDGNPHECLKASDREDWIRELTPCEGDACQGCVMKRAAHLMKFDAWPEREDVWIQIMIIETGKIYNFTREGWNFMDADGHDSYMNSGEFQLYDDAIYNDMYNAQFGEGIALQFVSSVGPGGWNTCTYSPIGIDVYENGRVGRITGEFNINIDGDYDSGTGDNGDEELNEWFAPDVGILVHDPPADGTVSGKHLLGDMGGIYPDGYAKLATFDSDHDGVVNGAELDLFHIWIDGNSNAHLDVGELYNMSHFNIVGVSTMHDCHKSKAYVQRSDGKIDEIETEDLWFSR